MPPGKKKGRQNLKNAQKAEAKGTVTCTAQVNLTGGGHSTGHGFSDKKGCAEPKAYRQAQNARSQGIKISDFSSVVYTSNEWPCQKCKAFLQQLGSGGAAILVNVDPRSGSDTYFTHWVDADVIPAGSSPAEPLCLRYTAQAGWVAGRLN